MRPENVLFLSACSFVGGAVAGGIGMPPLLALPITFPLVLLFASRLGIRVILGIGIVFVAGNIYYTLDDYAYRAGLRAAERITQFEGVIIDEPRRGIEVQTAEVKIRHADIEGASRSRVYLRTELLPELSYGDIVRVSGEVVPPPWDSYGNYMAKERGHGTIFYPDIEVLENEADPLFRTLFAVRNHLQTIL